MGKKYVIELIEKWLPRLGLNEWIINVEVVEKLHKIDKRCEAEIEEDIKYLEADMTVYSSFWNNDARHQEINIVHELVHLMFCRLHKHLSPSGDETLEEVVQRTAMLFYKTYNGKRQKRRN